jgi:hypothetical protein
LRVGELAELSTVTVDKVGRAERMQPDRPARIVRRQLGIPWPIRDRRAGFLAEFADFVRDGPEEIEGSMQRRHLLRRRVWIQRVEHAGIIRRMQISRRRRDRSMAENALD